MINITRDSEKPLGATRGTDVDAGGEAMIKTNSLY